VWEAVWGLAASCALYVVGCVSWVGLLRRFWAHWPAEVHPELRASREAAETWRLRSLFRIPGRNALLWLGGAVVVFLLLWLADFGLFFHVVYVAVVSTWWTAGWVRRVRRTTRKRYERLGVAPPVVGAVRRRAYRGGVYVFGFMISAGVLGTAAFLGAVIAEGVS
jgi:hypothetical protein